jgi:hypothetical protein
VHGYWGARDAPRRSYGGERITFTAAARPANYHPGDHPAIERKQGPAPGKRPGGAYAKATGTPRAIPKESTPHRTAMVKRTTTTTTTSTARGPAEKGKETTTTRETTTHEAAGHEAKTGTKETTTHETTTHETAGHEASRDAAGRAVTNTHDTAAREPGHEAGHEVGHEAGREGSHPVEHVTTTTKTMTTTTKTTAKEPPKKR